MPPIAAPVVIAALSALAQEHRLALFRLLVQAGAPGMAAGAIAGVMGVPASSLSFHLALMERAGIISRMRRGRSLIYAADFAAMGGLIAYLTENCCAGAASCADIAEGHFAVSSLRGAQRRGNPLAAL